MPKIQLSKNFIRSTCKLALNEDLYPSGDITTNLLNNNSISKVNLISNEKGIIGGLEFAKQTFNLLDRNIKFHIKKKEGSKVNKGSIIAIILLHLSFNVSLGFIDILGSHNPGEIVIKSLYIYAPLVLILVAIHELRSVSKWIIK